MCDVLYDVWLSTVLPPGSRLVTPIFSFYESAKMVYEERKHLSNTIPFTDLERESFANSTLEKANIILEDCERIQCQILTPKSEEYPECLYETYDFPLVLYRRGEPLKTEDQISVAVVGTRHPTEYAEVATRQITTELSKAGVTIVSGLAIGIDAIAHAAAIRSKGYTIAVVGGGLDINYPKANESLRRAIEERGTVLSEYAPGVEPAGWHFPVRNRILSGLSDGVFVTEGSLRSGTLRTAHHALEQGRDIFALPGSIFNRKADGTFQLLKDGAAPVASALDILEIYLEKSPEKINSSFIEVKEEPRPKNSRNLFKEKSKTFDILEKPISKKPLPSLDEESRKLYGILSTTWTHIDEIAKQMDQTTTDLFLTLTEMEMLGVIFSSPGKLYRKNEEYEDNEK